VLVFPLAQAYDGVRQALDACTLEDLTNRMVADLDHLRFSKELLTSKYQARFDSFLPNTSADPRTCESGGATIVKYNQWFSTIANHHHRLTLSKTLFQNLMSVRLGFSALRCNDHSTPRSERICGLCEGLHLEDEMHMIFDCPRYEFIRRDPNLKELYTKTMCLVGTVYEHFKSFMAQVDQYKMSILIYRLLQFRHRCLHRLDPIFNTPQLDTFSSSDDD